MQKFHKVPEVVDALDPNKKKEEPDKYGEFVFHAHFAKYPEPIVFQTIGQVICLKDDHPGLIRLFNQMEKVCGYKAQGSYFLRNEELLNKLRAVANRKRSIMAMTVVVLKNNDYRALGTAICIYPDDYNKKVGRLIARGRAEQQLAEKVLATKIGGKKS